MSSPAQTSLPAVFRLLVPATEDTQSVIYVGGRNWVLTEAIPFPPTHSTPAYTAISYACGLGRSPHPITGYEPMSDRTLGAVDAALLVHGAEALWIDSFCVPMDRLERAECLRRMGAIYARAAKVVVVLSEPCSAMLEQINASTRVDESALMALEADDWISRVWTYHEVVNNDYVYFVAAGGRVSVAAADLLRELTYALDDFKKAHALDSFELAGLFPRLNGSTI